MGRHGPGLLWSEGQEVRCLAAGHRLLQQQFAGHRLAQENGLQRPPSFYQQEQGTRGLLSPCVQESCDSPLPCVLASGLPSPQRTLQRNREKRDERLGDARAGKSVSLLLGGTGRVDSSNSRVVAC